MPFLTKYSKVCNNLNNFIYKKKQFKKLSQLLKQSI